LENNVSKDAVARSLMYRQSDSAFKLADAIR
jgi:hypothetical protein